MPFGHGVSYGATFHYSDIKLSKHAISTEGELEVTFSVTNNGTKPAEEVAQLYIRDEISSVTTPPSAFDTNDWTICSLLIFFQPFRPSLSQA